MKKVNLLNVCIDNLLRTELLEQLKDGVVFTPNVDHLIKLQTDWEFFEAYNIADYKVCDSQILLYASNFLGTPLKEKISGSDFFPAFYTYHKNNENIKIFLLGADKDGAKKAKEKINKKIERNIVVGSHSPMFGFEHHEKECMKILEIIKESGATVLAIGLGAPKQEKWIYKYKDHLPNIKIFLAIGATIDFEAGTLKRCPKWMSDVGLEWLHRFWSEPKRLWRRYLIEDSSFLWLIFKQKLNLYKSPISHEQIYEVGKTTSENKRSKETSAFRFDRTHEHNSQAKSSCLLNKTDSDGCLSDCKRTSTISLEINSQVTQSMQNQKTQPTSPLYYGYSNLT